jgi:hypothetical protein
MLAWTVTKLLESDTGREYDTFLPISLIKVTREKSLKHCHFLMTLCLVLSACQPATPLSPAPLGQRQALEKLADAYNDLSRRLPTSPSGLTPQGKLKFIQDVFKKAGYDYGGTLKSLAQIPRESVNTYHKDMMELLFLPHQGVSRPDLKTLYSDEEIKNIEKITALLSQYTGDTVR